MLQLRLRYKCASHTFGCCFRFSGPITCTYHGGGNHRMITYYIHVHCVKWSWADCRACSCWNNLPAAFTQSLCGDFSVQRLICVSELSFVITGFVPVTDGRLVSWCQSLWTDGTVHGTVLVGLSAELLQALCISILLPLALLHGELFKVKIYVFARLISTGWGRLLLTLSSVLSEASSIKGRFSFLLLVVAQASCLLLLLLLGFSLELFVFYHPKCLRCCYHCYLAFYK